MRPEAICYKVWVGGNQETSLRVLKKSVLEILTQKLSFFPLRDGRRFRQNLGENLDMAVAPKARTRRQKFGQSSERSARSECSQNLCCISTLPSLRRIYHSAQVFNDTTTRHRRRDGCGRAMGTGFGRPASPRPWWAQAWFRIYAHLFFGSGPVLSLEMQMEHQQEGGSAAKLSNGEGGCI